MELLRVIGIIAVIVFMVSYIGDKAIARFMDSVTSIDLEKVHEILDYVSTGAMVVASACGITNLFA